MRFANSEKQLLAVFLLILIAFPGVGVWASSHIAKFVFITEPQSIRAGELSQELTVQAQDAAGNPVEAGETLDLEFTSSSASGEFLNSSGNPVSTVMNKNWKSRNFYYRDSVAGEHTLRVKVTSKSWEAVQKITISSAEPTPAPPPPQQSAPAPSPVSSPAPEEQSSSPSAPVPQPAQAPTAAEPQLATETSSPPAGVREEESAVITATATPAAMPSITSVQVPVSRPAPESLKPAQAPEKSIKSESLPIASAAASPASAAIASAPRASSSPVFFFILASALSGITAVGFLAVKRFLAGAGTH